MKADVNAIVKALRRLRGGKQDTKPVGPSGLPGARSNDDNYTGTYEGENLTDPGFNHNGVTGTGDGPVIGMNRPVR